MNTRRFGFKVIRLIALIYSKFPPFMQHRPRYITRFNLLLALVWWPLLGIFYALSGEWGWSVFYAVLMVFNGVLGIWSWKIDDRARMSRLRLQAEMDRLERITSHYQSYRNRLAELPNPGDPGDSVNPVSWRSEQGLNDRLVEQRERHRRLRAREQEIRNRELGIPQQREGQ